MKLDNFLKQLKTSTNPLETCKKRVKEDYIPYRTKLEKCIQIVQRTNYSKVKDSEEEIFQVNTPVKSVLFSLTLISLYTDIEIDFANALDTFDSLEKANATDPLIASIPEKELKRFTDIIEMMEHDLYENNRSLAGYFDHNSRALFNLLEGLVPQE